MVSVWHPYLHLKMNQSDMINLTDRYFFLKIVPRVNSFGDNLDYGVLQKIRVETNRKLNRGPKE